MAFVMITRCDGPGCESFMQTAVGKPPTGWLLLASQGHNGQAIFCSWTCLALYAAQNASTYEKPAEQPMTDAAPEEPETNGHEPAEETVGTTSPTE